MANKIKQNAENKKQEEETWRKPLQVPPRMDAMQSFYRGGAEEESNEKLKQEKPDSELPEKKSANINHGRNVNSPPKKQNKEIVEPETKREVKSSQTKKIFPQSDAEEFDKLTEEQLSQHLGFEASELFDIHELLQGKSFDIYQNLLQLCDDIGRCKITQPELMIRTGIKNRRTFYKHEERLIDLKLLEKRHRPGDHKGVVYRVFEMKEVLPISAGMLEQFITSIKEKA